MSMLIHLFCPLLLLLLLPSGPEVYANTNAPPAVASSAIIYAMRCLVKRDIPLNQVHGSAAQSDGSCSIQAGRW
jgi:hypothetical protein